MYLMPLNCSLTVVTIVNFMLYAFYHNNRKQVGPEPWSHIPLPPTLYLHNLQMLAEQPWGNTRGQGPYPGAQDLKEAPQPLHHPHTHTHTYIHTYIYTHINNSVIHCSSRHTTAATSGHIPHGLFHKSHDFKH